MTIRKEKTTEDYIEGSSSHTKNSRENMRSAINNFSKFLKEKYGLTPEKLSEELKNTKKTKGDEEYEDELYYLLQNWINWNDSNNSGAYTIRMRFSIIRRFLYYFGIKSTPQDIKERLVFPKRKKEEKYPLQQGEFRI